MIGPERFKVELDLEDELPPLVLWYTPKALRAISEKLKFDLPLGQAYDTLEKHLFATTLATFVWAGRLWEDSTTPEKAYLERLDASPLHLNAKTDAVTRALWLQIYGMSPEEALAKIRDAKARVDAGDEGPLKPAALNGAGTIASSSPSASSDYP